MVGNVLGQTHVTVLGLVPPEQPVIQVNSTPFALIRVMDNFTIWGCLFGDLYCYNACTVNFCALKKKLACLRHVYAHTSHPYAGINSEHE